MFALLLMAASLTQEGAARDDPNPTPRDVWISCFEAFVFKAEKTDEKASTIVDAAFARCAFEEGQYRRWVSRQMRSRAGRQNLATTNVNTEKVRFRNETIAEIIDDRAKP